MSQLREIPGVGRGMEEDLIALGHTTIASLSGADPEELYRRECARKGCQVDRCVLYVFRCAVYYASTPTAEREAEKLKWWNWKDK